MMVYPQSVASTDIICIWGLGGLLTCGFETWGNVALVRCTEGAGGFRFGRCVSGFMFWEFRGYGLTVSDSTRPHAIRMSNIGDLAYRAVRQDDLDQGGVVFS